MLKSEKFFAVGIYIAIVLVTAVFVVPFLVPNSTKGPQDVKSDNSFHVVESGW